MGKLIFVTGFVIYAIGWFWLIRKAFKESLSLGIWVLVMPVIGVHFLFTRMERTAGPALVIFVGLLLVLAGIFVDNLAL